MSGSSDSSNDLCERSAVKDGRRYRLLRLHDIRRLRIVLIADAAEHHS